ncbi:MAG: GAF domain-containing sensor histidine kinase, partial [Chloroflexi bacterium]|nr:GAF domain-containing sensor histidine kinase [Chloroflexota bacterium]
ALRAASTRAEMLPVIVHLAFNLMRAKGAALFTRVPVTNETVIAFGYGAAADATGRRFPPGAGLADHVMTTRQPYFTNDAQHDLHTRTFNPAVTQAAACVPLIAQDRVVGALWVGRTTDIVETELRVLIAVSDIAASAFHRAEVLELLERRVAERTRELAAANTQLTAANDRLQDLDRLKSKFVSDVTHELRTPITALYLNVDLLEHGKPEKRPQYLQAIREQAQRQATLIDDILNLSRLELGAGKAKFAPVALNVLAGQTVGMHQTLAEARNLTLVFTPDPDLPAVPGEENQLAQVLANLIGNAINYTPTGTVHVRTARLEHEVQIEVCDTGLGIAPGDLPHLFDRFYRGSRTRNIRGTGLGLSIVKEIVDLHGGRIEVESEVNAGSQFRVYLPLHPA